MDAENYRPRNEEYEEWLRENSVNREYSPPDEPPAVLSGRSEQDLPAGDIGPVLIYDPNTSRGFGE